MRRKLPLLPLARLVPTIEASFGGTYCFIYDGERSEIDVSSDLSGSRVEYLALALRGSAPETAIDEMRDVCGHGFSVPGLPESRFRSV